jgi:hypothetical protein
MRYPAFSTIPVKEIAIVGPDAGTLCTDLGLPLGERAILGDRAKGDNSSILWPTRNPRSSDLTSIYRDVAYTHRYRDVADMKRGGLAAAQVKRHAGGTS